MRTNIDTTVAYLCMLVRKSGEGEWRKLIRLMNYLKKNVYDVSIIGENIVEEVFTWVDAEYAFHDDMKSQTEGTIPFGHGTVHCRPSKKILKTKSSTEAEIVGTSDYFPFNVWMVIFMGAQVYAVKKKNYARIIKSQSVWK